MGQDPAASPADADSAIAARYPVYAQLMARNVEVHRDRCQVLAGRHRRWFRLTGVLVIAFSVSLPVLTSLTFSGRNGVISVVALGVAGLSALRAFFQWDDSWRLYRSQDLTLTALLTRWQMGMLRIIGTTAPNASDEAYALTMDILHQAHESGQAELSEFFGGIAWPQKQLCPPTVSPGRLR
jgi:hypothetical protein